MSHLIINYTEKWRSLSGLDRIIYCGLAHPHSIFSASKPQQADEKIATQKINKKNWNVDIWANEKLFTHFMKLKTEPPECSPPPVYRKHKYLPYIRHLITMMYQLLGFFFKPPDKWAFYLKCHFICVSQNWMSGFVFKNNNIWK